MWNALSVDCSSPTESQVPGLIRIKGGNGNDPKTEQAGGLWPLRDTRPSGLKEKKVRLRYLLCP